MPKSHTLKFSDIFSELQDEVSYKELVKIRIAKIILPNSVIRVFKPGTKDNILDCLIKLKTEDILSLKNQTEFDSWHKRKITHLYRCIKKKNNNKFGEGMKWGHASKVLNLFLGHLVFFSPYFKPSNKLEKTKLLLHVPLDNKVFKVLRDCGVPKVPTAIKDLNRSSYNTLQREIRDKTPKKIPPIYFDEYAWSKLS